MTSFTTNLNFELVDFNQVTGTIKNTAIGQSLTQQFGALV